MFPPKKPKMFAGRRFTPNNLPKWPKHYKFNPNGAQGTFVTHLLPTRPN